VDDCPCTNIPGLFLFFHTCISVLTLLRLFVSFVIFLSVADRRCLVLISFLSLFCSVIVRARQLKDFFGIFYFGICPSIRSANRIALGRTASVGN
jgi:hypothetical protein